MNPEAVQWLEALDENLRVKYFLPVYPWDGKFFALKDDHEYTTRGRCAQCKNAEELVVID